MTKYYIDADGKYLGGFCGLPPTFDNEGNQLTTGWESIIIPEGAIEVPHAPQDMRQLWIGDKWQDVKEVQIEDRDKQAAYLRAWPVPQQLEAFQDALNGKPEKLNLMNAEILAIKQQYNHE